MPKKVLLIDYEPLSVERIRALLAPPEYSLSVAKDGEEGLAVSDASPFDTILVAGMVPRVPRHRVDPRDPPEGRGDRSADPSHGLGVSRFEHEGGCAASGCLRHRRASVYRRGPSVRRASGSRIEHF